MYEELLGLGLGHRVAIYMINEAMDTELFIAMRCGGFTERLLRVWT
jgi:hypothetical protein